MYNGMCVCVCVSGEGGKPPPPPHVKFYAEFRKEDLLCDAELLLFSHLSPRF